MSAVSFLIADPSAAVQTFAQQVLTGYGFDAASIKTTGNPLAASEIAQSLKPVFLLTDWFAKEPLSGIALHRSIFQNNPDCRFALLSASSSAEWVQEARDAGAMFLLTKPFTGDALRAELSKALDQLAKDHPKIAQQVHAHSHTSTQSSATRIQLPVLPQYKPGDRVMYQNRMETVKNVILRRGDLVLQLQNVSGFIEATRVQRTQ